MAGMTAETTERNAILFLLDGIRKYAGPRQTIGLPDQVIADFARRDPNLMRAVEEAVAAHRVLREEWAAELRRSESEVITLVQQGFVNFYRPPTVNPYITISARGPWVVTTHGAVIHDSGGYGMMGFGHGPDAVIDAMAKNHVMANIMSPNFSQLRLTQRLFREVGHTRGGCPFTRFICMNSGSESVTVGMRIADANAMRLTAADGPHAGKRPVLMSLEGSFHGRTDRPAQLSDSCLGTYRDHLHSFANRDNLITVPPNDVDALTRAFASAEANGQFIEAMLIEPVMGEGNPGECVTRAFYDAARRLTSAHGSLLVADSIQAGFRGTGALSIVDYPGFEDALAPDLETYSKALNAGQYPFSVLALNERAAGMYVKGIYGNTMTTNPRALEVAVAVLDSVTPALRENIRVRGVELVDKLLALADELGDGIITSVQGTGLLLAAELDPKRFDVVGFDGIETRCRKRGFGVIHGGKNALRLTPHFAINSAEIDLIIGIIRDVLTTAAAE
jgi:acetylornithine/succinyldiaminopimelate/putrescine aminotransferase